MLRLLFGDASSSAKGRSVKQSEHPQRDALNRFLKSGFSPIFRFLKSELRDFVPLMQMILALNSCRISKVGRISFLKLAGFHFQSWPKKIPKG